jgi:hypothetical protein
VTISGQTPAGAAFAKNGEESLRTVYFDPAFARVTVDTSVNPPRLVVSLSPDNTGVELSSATPLAIGTAAAGNGTEASAWNHVHAHGDQLGGSLHAVAVAGASAGFISAANQTKLEAIEAGADVTDFGNVSAALSAASGNISINSVRIANVADPVDDDDADTKGARNDAIAAASSGAKRLDFGATNNVTSATPRYLCANAGWTTPAISPARFLPINRSITLTSITVGQTPGLNSGVWRYEIYKSTGGGAWAATGQYVDLINTGYFVTGTLGSPVSCVSGDRVGLVSYLQSGAISSSATDIQAFVEFTVP